MNNCILHSNEEIVELLKQARVLYENYSYEDCAEIVSHLIEFHIDENNKDEAKFLIGASLVYQDKSNEGLRYLEGIEFENYEVGNTEFYLELVMTLGQCHRNLYNYKNALFYFLLGEKYLYLWKSETNNILEWYLLEIGKCQSTLNEYKKALTTFKRVLEITKNSPTGKYQNEYYTTVYYHLAENYQLQNDLTKAELFINKINTNFLSDTYKPCYFDLKIIILKLNNKHQEAIDTFICYEKLGILESNKSQTYHSAGQAYFEINEFDLAKVSFEKALKSKDPINPVHKFSKNYLKFWTFGERKYIILDSIMSILTSFASFIIYLSMRFDIYNTIFPQYTNYYTNLIRLWLPPLLISIMINLFIRDKYFIKRKWLSRQNIFSKSLFYLPYIILVVLIITLEFSNYF